MENYDNDNELISLGLRGYNPNKPKITMNLPKSVNELLVRLAEAGVPLAYTLSEFAKNPDAHATETLQNVTDETVPFKHQIRHGYATPSSLAKEAVLLAAPMHTHTNKINARLKNLGENYFAEEKPMLPKDIDYLNELRDSYDMPELDYAIIKGNGDAGFGGLRNNSIENYNDIIDHMTERVENMIDNYNTEYPGDPAGFMDDPDYYHSVNEISVPWETPYVEKEMILDDFRNIAPDVYGRLIEKGYDPKLLKELWPYEFGFENDPRVQAIVTDKSLSKHEKNNKLEMLRKEIETENALDVLEGD